VPLPPWLCQLLQRKEGGGWGWIWDSLNQSRRGGLWYDIETVRQSVVAHCDKTYCAKCCDRSSEDEDYHETVWINRGLSSNRWCDHSCHIVRKRVNLRRFEWRRTKSRTFKQRIM
jgi:hypothetical protein